MDERSIKSWWQRRLPDVSAAVTRFPLAVAIAVVLTVYKLFHGMIGDAEFRVLAWLAASFVWVVSVDLFAESQRRSPQARGLLWLLGIAVLALLLWLDTAIWLNARLLVGSLILALTLAGHLGRRETNETFWLFNHRLWLGALLAGVGAGLLGAGLIAIHETVKLLFGLTLSRLAPEYILTVCFGIVAPVSFLAFAPRRFTDPITASEQHDFTMRAAAALVKFVAVPLLLVYTAILYAYAAKIALAWELPKGTLGAMVVGYLFAGAATLLLGYPSRETGGALVRLFWRYWVWLAALPVVLLFVAVSRRIADYGVTEQRYLMVLIGVWALILAAFRLAQGARFDLRLLPGVAALLLLAASFGPGGAIGLSVLSQKAELASILASKGMLADGKIVPRGRGCRRESAWRGGFPRPRHRMVSQHPPFARSACAVVRGHRRRSLRARQVPGGDRARAACRARATPRSRQRFGRGLFQALFGPPGRARSRQGRLCRWPDRARRRANAGAHSARERGRRRARHGEARAFRQAA